MRFRVLRRNVHAPCSHVFGSSWVAGAASKSIWGLKLCLATLFAYSCLVPLATGQQVGVRQYPPTRPQVGVAPIQQQQPIRLAERSDPVRNQPSESFTKQNPNEHPLMPALRWAAKGLREIEKIHDYSATVVKRERVNDKVGEHEYLFIKVRHQPFSVYMSFLGPPTLKGQEVIYIEGQNSGNILAHGTGLKKTMFGTVSLKPDGVIAMRGQRYPITELGVKNLMTRLVEIGRNDTKFGECEVKFLKGAKINGRPCTCIQVMHPKPRRNFLFHLARIFIDEERNLPLRYEAYDWPLETGGTPRLLEEYTYLHLKINQGFTDADFDVRNPNYQFNK